MLNIHKTLATPLPHKVAPTNNHMLTNILLLYVGTPAWNLIDFRAPPHKPAAELIAEWKLKRYRWKASVT